MLVPARAPSSKRAALTPRKRARLGREPTTRVPTGLSGAGWVAGEGKKEREGKVGRGEQTHVMSRHPARFSWHGGFLI